MALVQTVVIGLIALILAPGYFFYFDVTPKLVILFAGTAFCCVIWRGRVPARVMTVLMVCSAASLAASAAVSFNPALSIFGSTWRRFGVTAQCAVFVLAWLAATNGSRGRIIILRGIAVASALAAMYGIAQYLGWDPILPAGAYHIGEGIWTIVRPPSTLGYVSYFATWLLMGGFLSLSLAAWESAAGLRRAAYVCAALCFAAMLLTGTRAALVGAAAGAVIAAYRWRFRISRRAAGAGLAVVTAIVLFYFSPPGWLLRSRMRWFVEDPWGGARPLLWRDSLRMAMARPVTGFGPEVFTAAFPPFESRELARKSPDFAHESPHNIFLDALVSQGLAGAACLIALCVVAMRSGWKQKRPWMCAALGSGIAAQQFSVFTIPTAVLFYVTAALLIAPEESSARPHRFRLSARAGALAAAALMLYGAVRYAAADRSLELARRDIEVHDLRSASMHYTAYMRWKFPGAVAGLWYSRALLSIGAIIPAGQAALAAVHSAEDPFNAWYNLAEIYAIGNSTAETESCLRHAVSANPAWFKPHWMLAQVLRLENRTAAAAAEAAVAADLDGGKHPEVGRTLAETHALQK